MHPVPTRRWLALSLAHRPTFRQRLLLVACLTLLLSAACAAPNRSSGGSAPSAVRLGFFPNVTHATGIVGLEAGIFARHLPLGTGIEPLTFNAGPSAIEALFAGGLDLTYIGPNPALNGYFRSRGEDVRILAGATSGGAALVVRPEITSARDLAGKRVASPQLGNTQDVALRHWLQTQGYRTEATGAGDVTVIPQENAQTLDAFRSGQIDGAWAPEPWATRLVLDGGGRVLLDERELWPGGQFVTVHLIVRSAFLRDHPAIVEAILRAHVEANDYVNAEPAEAQRLVNQSIRRLTGQAMSEPVLRQAWSNLTFTYDPIASSLRKSADDAAALGFLTMGGTRLDAIYEVAPLNRQLAVAGRPSVSVL